MRKAAPRIAAALLAAVALQAQAFGAAGHLAIGTLADRLIAGTPTAKHVRRILGTNLRTAAVWADCAKGISTTSFRYGERGRYPECAIYENAASERQMASFVRRNHRNCGGPPDADSCHRQYHYADVAIQRTAYRKGLVGTSDHDVVAAVNAAIAVLQDRQPAAPFAIANKKEALRLLAHYVGDLHQPLHVASVYLDRRGKVVDPDEGSFDPRTGTRGGSELYLAAEKPAAAQAQGWARTFHAEWDGVDDGVGPDPSMALLDEAAGVAETPGDVTRWAALWATDTLRLAPRVFGGLRFSAADARNHHTVTLPQGYETEVLKPVQREQVAKAGARLAQLLMAIWPQ